MRGVASASLCADAYLFALLEPGEIQAVSWQVDEPVSEAPDWARDYPRAWADAERLYHLSAAHVVFGPGEGTGLGPMLAQAGVETVHLHWGEGFQTVRENLRLLGRAFGREDRAEREITQLDRRLEALAGRAQQRSARRRVFYLSSSGGSAGDSTYIDAAITAAGGDNVVAANGATGWTRSDPEQVLGLSADLIVTSFFENGYEGRLNRARYHAAYRQVLDTEARIEIPSGYWPCAGPHLIDAAERIADALDRLEDEG